MLQRWGFKREGLSFFQVDTAGLNGLAVSTLPFVSIPFKSQAVKSASRTASFGQRHLLYSCRLRLGHMAGTPFHLSWLSSMKHRQFPCPDWTAGGFLHEGAVSCSHEVALYLLMDRFHLQLPMTNSSSAVRSIYKNLKPYPRLGKSV